MSIDHLAATPALLGAPLERGDDGFDRFVLETGERMMRSALMLCGDHHLAEDLTQTTYAKVFAHWHKVSRADSQLAYARTVLLRTFLTHRRLRSTAERPSESLPDLVGSGPDLELRMDLMAALRALSARDRAVLVLRYWDDLSVAETASILRIRESTCRTWAARALVRLRTQLSDVLAVDEHPDDHPGEHPGEEQR